jgi:hypothetical protein
MPTTGAYEFKRAEKSVNGLIDDENKIGVGEWAWVDYSERAGGGGKYLLILMRDPDCKMLATLWRGFKDQVHGHDIDSHGNVSPSVLHNFPFGDPPVEMCGFHTQPTKLLDFVDLR